MKATSNKAWKKKSAPSGQIWRNLGLWTIFFSPIWANLGLGPKNLALFRGHLLFILGKI